MVQAFDHRAASIVVNLENLESACPATRSIDFERTVLTRSGCLIRNTGFVKMHLTGCGQTAWSGHWVFKHVISRRNKCTAR